MEGFRLATVDDKFQTADAATRASAGACRLCANTKEDCPLLSDDAASRILELTVYRFSAFEERHPE